MQFSVCSGKAHTALFLYQFLLFSHKGIFPLPGIYPCDVFIDTNGLLSILSFRLLAETSQASPVPFIGQNYWQYCSQSCSLLCILPLSITCMLLTKQTMMSLWYFHRCHYGSLLSSYIQTVYPFSSPSLLPLQAPILYPKDFFIRLLW